MTVDYLITEGAVEHKEFISDAVIYLRERSSLLKVVGICSPPFSQRDLEDSTIAVLNQYTQSIPQAKNPSSLEAWVFGGNDPFVDKRRIDGRLVHVLYDGGIIPQVLLTLDKLGIGAVEATPVRSSSKHPVFTYKKDLRINEDGSFSYSCLDHLGILPDAHHYEKTWSELL